VVAERAAALRREFDAQFAGAPRAIPDTEDFLLVRVGARPYALRLVQLGGIAKGRVLVSAPARSPGFLGLAGIRGMVVGVYGMATLLSGEERASSTPWLALSGGDDPVALAFEQLDAFARVESSSVHDDADGDAPGRLTRGVLKTPLAARPVVDLVRMFAVVRRSDGAAGSQAAVSRRRDP
jgi:purine-binding chemotaxis protein CheW